MQAGIDPWQAKGVRDLTKEAVWQRPFKFTDEQRRDLLATLRRDDAPAHALIGAVELLVPRFLADYEYFVRQDTETPREARAILNRIARNAKALADDLENLDLMGSSGAFAQGCTRLGRPIESLGYLSSELLLVHVAATAGAESIGPVQRGRRSSPTELSLIAGVAMMYEHHLGLRASTSRGSRFINFMSRVFLCVDATNPRSLSDISKFAAKALAKRDLDGTAT